MRGEIGEARSIMVNFSYYNRDPANVRNPRRLGRVERSWISGCYAIQVSRFILEQEPLRVAGLIDRDPEFGTDRLTSALIEFPPSASSVHLQHADDSCAARSNFWNDRPASKSKFRSTRRTIAPRASSSIAPAKASPPTTSPSSISTRCKAMRSRAPSWTIRNHRRRYLIPSATWP